jgi:predicted DNA-binding transcriptional regulator AlpA
MDTSVLNRHRLLFTREELSRAGIKLSNSTMLRLEKIGAFPKRVRLGAHSVAWVAAEIDAHVATLVRARELDK